MQVYSHQTIKLSKCYSEITPESAADGDHSDMGMIETGETYDMDDLMNIRDEYIKTSDSETTSETWLASGYFTTCYETGTEREETLHRDSTDEISKQIWIAFIKDELEVIDIEDEQREPPHTPVALEFMPEFLKAQARLPGVS